jgi:hypothetical protein
MRNIVSALILIATMSGISFAGELAPYTFGMKVVAPEMQTGKQAIVQPTGATAKVLTVTTGGVEKFSITAPGVMTATSFAGSGAGLTAVPAASIAAGALLNVTNLTATGTVELGAALTKSTFTATGDATIHNNVSAANVIIRGSGYLFLGFKTKAALLADAPLNQGEVWYCSDCTKDTLVVSTGTAAGQVSTIFDRQVVIQ